MGVIYRKQRSRSSISSLSIPEVISMRYLDWTLQIQSIEPILDLIIAMHAFASVKLTLMSGGTAKWQNDCLAFVKPWVWSPTPHKKNDSLIMLLIQDLFSHISLFLNKNFTFKTGKQQYSYSKVIDWPLVEIFLNYWMSFLLTVKVVCNL